MKPFDLTKHKLLWDEIIVFIENCRATNSILPLMEDIKGSIFDKWYSKNRHTNFYVPQSGCYACEYVSTILLYKRFDNHEKCYFCPLIGMKYCNSGSLYEECINSISKIQNNVDVEESYDALLTAAAKIRDARVKPGVEMV